MQFNLMEYKRNKKQKRETKIKTDYDKTLFQDVQNLTYRWNWSKFVSNNK